jgi:hemolysin activation/secretion protein
LIGIGWFRATQSANGGYNSLRIGLETNGQHNDGIDPTALLAQVRFDLQNLSGENVQIFTRVRGTLTASSAPVLKRFQLGGPDSVRAYDYAISEGDGGIDATAEFRFGGVNANGLRRQFVMFVDGGYVDSHSDTVILGSSAQTLIGGAGLGLRFGAPGFEFAMEYAYPIGQHATPDGDNGGYFWGRLSVGLD